MSGGVLEPGQSRAETTSRQSNASAKKSSDAMPNRFEESIWKNDFVFILVLWETNVILCEPVFGFVCGLGRLWGDWIQCCECCQPGRMNDIITASIAISKSKQTSLSHTWTRQSSFDRLACRCLPIVRISAYVNFCWLIYSWISKTEAFWNWISLF